LLELRQIFTKFDYLWHTDSQDDRIMWSTRFSTSPNLCQRTTI